MKRAATVHIITLRYKQCPRSVRTRIFGFWCFASGRRTYFSSLIDEELDKELDLVLVKNEARSIVESRVRRYARANAGPAG